MSIVERIQSEHRDIRRRLEAFDQDVVGLAMGRLRGEVGLVASLDTFIQASVLPHFRLEEKAVFPQLATGSPQDNKLGKELMGEHLALRDHFFSYVVEARKGKVSEEFLALTRDMTARLTRHSQREDADLLPLLRDWMSLAGVPLAPAGAGDAEVTQHVVPPAQDGHALSERAQLLAGSRLFSRLGGAELSSLAALARWRDWPAGEVIATEGQKATTVWVIERGTVAVTHTIPTQAGTMDFTAALATSGDALGWSALIEPHQYNGTARCMVAARCLELDGAALHNRLAGSPATHSKVMENLAMMVRDRLNTTMEALARNL